MARDFKPREVLAFTNPNKALVVQELDKLRKEWAAWLDFGRALGESPDFNPNTCTDAVKDGFENLHKHDVLRERTLVFIGNNFTGYSFLFDNWPSPPHEDTTSRIVQKAPGWIRRLDTLAAAIDYARVPDSYWKARGKDLVDAITRAGPDKAIDVASSYLKGTSSS